jgi:Kinesin motor domain
VVCPLFESRLQETWFHWLRHTLRCTRLDPAMMPVQVAGLHEECVTCPEAVLQLLARGEAHRHFGETKMNVKSSRSHTIFRMVCSIDPGPWPIAWRAVGSSFPRRCTLAPDLLVLRWYVAASQVTSSPTGQVVESQPRDADSEEGRAVRVSRLTLVDLAGSERLGKTGMCHPRLSTATMASCLRKHTPDFMCKWISSKRCLTAELENWLPCKQVRREFVLRRVR